MSNLSAKIPSLDKPEQVFYSQSHNEHAIFVVAALHVEHLIDQFPLC